MNIPHESAGIRRRIFDVSGGKKMPTIHFTLKYIPFTHHGTIGYTLCDNSGTVFSAFIKSWYNIHMYP